MLPSSHRRAATSPYSALVHGSSAYNTFRAAISKVSELDGAAAEKEEEEEGELLSTILFVVVVVVSKSEFRERRENPPTQDVVVVFLSVWLAAISWVAAAPCSLLLECVNSMLLKVLCGEQEGFGSIASSLLGAMIF
jgi:hypothetical protein